MHAVTEQDSDSCEDIMTVTAVTQEMEAVNHIKDMRMAQNETQQLFAGMMINNNLVSFQTDCGATCNVMPVHMLNPDTQIEHTDKVLVMYNKSKLRPVVKCKVKVRNPRNQKLYRLEFQVVGEDCKTPLLGRKASEAMKLIKVQYENISIDSIVSTTDTSESTWTLDEIKTEFKDVFTGDGCLEGEYKIEIDSTVEPVKLPKRRVPVAMMKPL